MPRRNMRAVAPPLVVSHGTNYGNLRFSFTMHALVALLLFMTAPAMAAPSVEEEVTRGELEVRQLLNEDQ